MDSKEFDDWWNGLSPEAKKHVKDLVIARLEQLPDNIKLSIGSTDKIGGKGKWKLGR